METLECSRLKYTVEYRAWLNMISRCTTKNPSFYKKYGARGITVCKRWRESFTAFLEDMGRKPSPDLSLDRINNDGNYKPGNCRWATDKEQANNRRPRKSWHRKIYPKRKKQCLANGQPALQSAVEIAKELGVEASTVLRWHREKKIPSVRISRATIRFDLNEVLKALKKQDKEAKK